MGLRHSHQNLGGIGLHGHGDLRPGRNGAFCTNAKDPLEGGVKTFERPRRVTFRPELHSFSDRLNRANESSKRDFLPLDCALASSLRLFLRSQLMSRIDDLRLKKRW
jgi:hypothetical protein